jgi:hypothetical protein
MLLARGGPKQASPPRSSRPNRRAGPCGARLILTADLPTCRPADLPTCRPADLPTCRLESRRAPDASTSFNSDVGSFDASFLSGATTARSRDSNSLDVSSDTTVPHRSSDLTNTIIISEELNIFNICPKCIRR